MFILLVIIELSNNNLNWNTNIDENVTFPDDINQCKTASI